MIERRAVELLAEKGVYITTTAGTSMLPMLRHHRDTVTVVPLRGAAKKYDVVLFRRGEKLVLHRVINIAPNGYLIRGDHCRESELVQETQLLGILSAFTRNGKTYTLYSPGYVAYSRAIVWLHPVLCLGMGVKNLLKRVLKRKK